MPLLSILASILYVTAAFRNHGTETLLTEPSTDALHQLLYRRIVLPVLALLRMGASPRRLAWSIAIGLLVGINPLLGSTTVLCLAVAFACRLNLAASQLANHAMYPFQVLLLLPFLRLSAWLFRSPPFLLEPKALLTAARSHPIDLVRSAWVWEWHAMVLWFVLALLLVAPLAELLHHILRRIKYRHAAPTLQA